MWRCSAPRVSAVGRMSRWGIGSLGSFCHEGYAMSTSTRDLMPLEIRRPDRPESMNFAFRKSVDPESLYFARSADDRQRLFDRLKWDAARALADHIAKHCKWFDRSTPMNRDMAIQIELTINDRGAYENFFPVAKQEGRKEGWASAMRAAAESLPYGIADAATEYYE